MDPQARRNALSLVRSFLLRLSFDKRDPVPALEAAALARIVDDLLNSGHEQEIPASLGRIEARLAAVRNGGTAEFKVSEVITVDPRSPEEKKAWRDASDLIAWEAFEAFCAARCERELKEATVAQP